jgi:hypothetical protein
VQADPAPQPVPVAPVRAHRVRQVQVETVLPRA